MVTVVSSVLKSAVNVPLGAGGDVRAGLALLQLLPITQWAAIDLRCPVKRSFPHRTRRVKIVAAVFRFADFLPGPYRVFAAGWITETPRCPGVPAALQVTAFDVVADLCLGQVVSAADGSVMSSMETMARS